jgi:Chaperone of endosialidase
MPTPQIVRFPLDPTGISTNNFVQGEPVTMVHRVTRAIAPQYGAFYTQSLRVFDGVSNAELVKGVQYYAAELYEVPTAKYGKEVCAIIIIKDTSVSDTVRLNYQAVGGEFSASTEAIVSQMNNLQSDDRPVRWGDIIDKPSEYTPTHHLHDLGDIYGFESLVHAVNRVRAAVLLGDSASHDEIYSYVDQHIAEEQAAAAAAAQTVSNHVTNTSNPHKTTATQIGLGNVQNLPLANQQEAEAGQANNRYMTPLSVKQSILINVPEASDSAKGKVALNIGTTAGDDTNALDALTATGWNSLVSSGTNNAVKASLRGFIDSETYLRLTTADARYQPLLGYTPVRQGGGAGQLTNVVYIGWSGSRLKATVDVTDLGNLMTDGIAYNTFLSKAGDTMTGRLVGSNSGLTMDQDAGLTQGSFVCRASGVRLAGMTFWHDAYATKLAVRSDGVFALGGWSMMPYAWYVDPSGNSVSAGNVYAYSDPRLKENLQQIYSPLERLLKLTGRRFTWKSGINHTAAKAGKADYGLMANEVEEIFPEIVGDSASIEGDVYKVVAYDKLVPVLIEAIRELTARIGGLEALAKSSN